MTYYLGLVVRNTSGTHQAIDPTFRVVLRDAAGAELSIGVGDDADPVLADPNGLTIPPGGERGIGMRLWPEPRFSVVADYSVELAASGWQEEVVPFRQVAVTEVVPIDTAVDDYVLLSFRGERPEDHTRWRGLTGLFVDVLFRDADGRLIGGMYEGNYECRANAEGTVGSVLITDGVPAGADLTRSEIHLR